MERSLRYVWRDPKTKAAWVTSLAIGLIVPVFNAAPGHRLASTSACFAAGMLGIQMYNQFGQDTLRVLDGRADDLLDRATRTSNCAAGRWPCS